MSVGPVAPTTVSPLTAPLAPITAAPASTTSLGASGADFGSMLTSSINNLQAMQNKTDSLAVQAATGNLTDVHDYMISSTETQLATQLAVTVRDKAVDAFNEIMRMQV